MNRRSLLASLAGANHTHKALQTSPISINFKVENGLEPYEGPWDFEQVAHLLRRTTFAPGLSQFNESAALGLEGTLEKLFENHSLPGPPINYYYKDDPFVSVGEIWITAPYSRTVNLQGYRRRTLRAWTIGQILSEGISIREKLTLFWHNHFAISNINDPTFEYMHISLLREYAWGNFKELIKKITIDPAMLRFLNGNQNTSSAPNENYARELLELYTIGKGDLAGPGDYTTFTEDDVVQIARVLTGWRDRGYLRKDANIEPGSYYTNGRHDTGQKQLSHRFNNEVISNGGNQEYSHLIDLIFEQKEVARFISRKLYRWFVYYVIDDYTEVQVIEPMADLLIASNFEIKPVLKTLLGSAHFFSLLNVGPMIKNPIELLVGPFKQFNIQFSDEYPKYYNAWWQFFRLLPLMQMEYFKPPDVAGWKAYYQEPSYYRIWINSSTIAVRMAFLEKISSNGYTLNGFSHKIDVLAFVKQLTNPGDPNKLIQEIGRLLYPQSLAEKQEKALKETLIPGLPDYVWTEQYTDYISNPNDRELRATIENRLRSLLGVMLTMPEYQLS